MTPDAADLRARLVARLRARGDVRTPSASAAAFARVPRHPFVPGVPRRRRVYTDRSIAIKIEDGVPISSSSQPAIMAEMLEMLGCAAASACSRSARAAATTPRCSPSWRRRRVPSSRSTSTTISRTRARAASSARATRTCARLRRRRARRADGAPFDAVIATVGVDAIPPAWIAQLREGGRLVAPLTAARLQKVVAFGAPRAVSKATRSSTRLHHAARPWRAERRSAATRTARRRQAARLHRARARRRRNAAGDRAARTVRRRPARVHDPEPRTPKTSLRDGSRSATTPSAS